MSISIANVLGPHDAAAVLWAEGKPESAMVMLAQRIGREGLDTRDLVQLLLWHEAADTARKQSDLFIRLARHVQVDTKPLAGENAAMITVLVNALEPASAGCKVDARFLTLLADVIEPEFGPGRSAKLYHAAILRDGSIGKAYVGLARALVTLRKYAKCAQVVELGLKNAPGTNDLFPIAMHVCAKLGRDEVALDYAKRWVEQDPTNLDALTKVAQQLFAERQLPECRALFERAAFLEPENPLWHNVLATLWIHTAIGVRPGEPRRHPLIHARMELQRSLQIEPNQLMARDMMVAVDRALERVHHDLPPALLTVPDILDAMAPILMTSDSLDCSSVLKTSSLSFDDELLSSLPDNVTDAGTPIPQSQRPRANAQAVVIGAIRETHEIDDLDPYAR